MPKQYFEKERWCKFWQNPEKSLLSCNSSDIDGIFCYLIKTSTYTWKNFTMYIFFTIHGCVKLQFSFTISYLLLRKMSRVFYCFIIHEYLINRFKIPFILYVVLTKFIRIKFFFCKYSDIFHSVQIFSSHNFIIMLINLKSGSQKIIFLQKIFFKKIPIMNLIVKFSTNRFYCISCHIIKLFNCVKRGNLQ